MRYLLINVEYTSYPLYELNNNVKCIIDIQNYTS